MNFRDDNVRFAEQFNLAPGAFTAPTIAVELTAASAAGAGNVAAFLMAINLLPRTFATVHAVFPAGTRAGPHPWGLPNIDEVVTEIAAATDGALHTGVPARADILLSIGAPGTVAATRTVLVSGTNWRSALDGLLEGDGDGVLGSLYAACIGAAQVLLHSLQLVGAPYRPMAPFEFSLLDFANPSADGELPTNIVIPETHMVGVGAIGSALVYVLGHLGAARGRLHLIDNDHVERRNLNRYILMRLCDLTRLKVDVGVDALRGTAMSVTPLGQAFADYVDQHGDAIELLLSPVDSEEGRRSLARSLPHHVLNAATGGTTVTISRHGFADGKACLHCLYMPKPNEATTERTMADDMGLPVEQVIELVRSNLPVDEALAALVERNRGVEPGTYADKAGLPIHSFYARAVCSDAELRLPTASVIAPLSFISASAGVLLAAELIKLSQPTLSAYSLDNYFRIDTLFPPNPAFRRARGQEISRSCICWDDIYRDVYRAKYL